MSVSGSTTPDALPGVSLGPELHFDASLGAAFIGLIVSAVLFGVTNVQTLIYYQKFPRDPKIVKYTIALLWVLDAVHLAFTSHMLYVYLVTNFTNILAVTKPTWSLGSQGIVTTIIIGLVRLFYARRLWIMSNRKLVMPLGALILSAIGITTALVISVKLILYKSIFDLSKISWLMYMGLSEVVAADLWCVVPLCYFLSRDRTGFRTTDTRINTLIAYIINTGLLTSVFSACCLITFGTLPHTYVFMPFYFCLSKLYINALLAMLNARNSLSENASAKNSERNAYQLPRVINLNTPQSSSNHKTSFGTLTDSVGKDTQIGSGSETNSRGSEEKAFQGVV